MSQSTLWWGHKITVGTWGWDPASCESSDKYTYTFVDVGRSGTCFRVNVPRSYPADLQERLLTFHSSIFVANTHHQLVVPHLIKHSKNQWTASSLRCSHSFSTQLGIGRANEINFAIMSPPTLYQRDTAGKSISLSLFIIRGDINNNYCSASPASWAPCQQDQSPSRLVWDRSVPRISAPWQIDRTLVLRFLFSNRKTQRICRC